MAKEISLKTIKEHLECVCGFTSAEQFQERIKWKDLKGYSARKFKTGERYWLIKIQLSQCVCCEA
jgi:hypothetical protein